MQHLDYVCRTNRELNLTKYIISIAGLVDIYRIAKTEYVVSIAGLVDINRITRLTRETKQQIDKCKLFFWLELGT